MDGAEGPEIIIWDITYACPLRCVHCYSESGRRPARHLRSAADGLRVADAFLALKPRVVSLAGGEPLLIKNLLDIAGKLTAASVSTCLYTSGWLFDEGLPDRLAEVFSQITVSVDGAHAATHDRVRGRAGSFDRALTALGHLDAAAARRAAAGLGPLNFTSEYVVLRSNIGELEDFVRLMARRFPRLGSITFNAAAPAGLGSGVEFGETELLFDEQLEHLVSAEFRRRLQDIAGPDIRVFTTDNLGLVMPPDPRLPRDGSHVMQVEPDGEVRWMPVYEGSVGNLLHDDPHAVWARAKERWADPDVLGVLEPVRTVREWARAVRLLNDRFASDADRERLEKRKAPVPVALTARPS
ncbi:Antilisterial bacteriocin subtilosin biosynthesis protein AlbA [Streptomyces sp. YIM 121038]|uniref:radical SAM protein n=1 Tax=Streptomyces sp. YIM 121038 TaxID=2136401 RepID=UPI001110B076|nr:radical SAM protein [Streptomyces sp. YIM 121038]QCX79847.1 Antilisterial bacteriocin subtilosin biosynthesis protein AlbA [Streptomyces sp. YIM 121038]